MEYITLNFHLFEGDSTTSVTSAYGGSLVYDYGFTVETTGRSPRLARIRARSLSQGHHLRRPAIAPGSGARYPAVALRELIGG